VKPIAIMSVIAAMGLASVPRAAGSPASEAARVALAEKADLPNLRPVLPSLLNDRDVVEPGEGRQGPSREAQREAGKTAGSAADQAHAAAEARAAAREAARAEADQSSAAEKARDKHVKQDHAKPHPQH
jgi:hypothetical protein